LGLLAAAIKPRPDNPARHHRSQDFQDTSFVNDDPQPQTNKNIIYVVILTVAVCTVVGVMTFATCMLLGLIIAVFDVINHRELPPIAQLQPAVIVVSAFGNIVTLLLGYLAGVLSKTSPTETTKHVDVSNAPTITDSNVQTPPPIPPATAV
jgi:uncharacterized membrane protein YjgN (DUF898 family)